MPHARRSLDPNLDLLKNRVIVNHKSYGPRLHKPSRSQTNALQRTKRQSSKTGNEKRQLKEVKVLSGNRDSLGKLEEQVVVGVLEMRPAKRTSTGSLTLICEYLSPFDRRFTN